MSSLLDKLLTPQALKIAGAVAGTALALATLRRLTLGVWWDPVCKPQDLTGKTAVVTGGTTGLGFETALGLAKMGAKVIITGCSESRGRAAVAELTKRSKNSNVTFIAGDMADFAAVNELAKKILAEAPVINILVNNAGKVYSGKVQKVTKDGHCEMFQVNFLSHFLLTNSLIPALLASPTPSRIVSVSSKLADKVDASWEDTTNFNTTRAYGQSKLAQILHMKTLHIQHQPNITAVSCMPGLSRTPLLANLDVPLVQKIIIFLLQPIFISILRSPKSGAQTILFCAVDPSVCGGKFYDNMAERKICGLNNCAVDPAQLQKLWDYSEKALAPFLSVKQ